MKELNAFRKFLSENIAPDQIVFSSRYRDENEGLEVILYVIAKSEEEATQMANQYMDENYIDSYKFNRTQPLGATFGDLDPGEQELFKGNIADFGVDTFMEGKGSTVKLSQSDMDKLHKDKEIEVDDHIIQFGEGEENVSENTTMPDIDIMGEKFNFSDICPSAHKLVQNQALVYQGHSRVLPTVLSFAIKHKNFFNLERKALGPQGITVDEFNDEVKRLYVEILNIAEKLMVRKATKEYMDMHMAKIKDAGFKASEPGGSSDRNFEEGYEPTDKELDFADEIEYEQDWRDEQDDLFGTPDYKRRRGYYMDEEGDEDEFLEEKLEEVRNRLGDVIEGYTDLHKNDVVLESFLGEEELNEDNTEDTFDDYFAPVVGGNKTMPAMNIQQALEDKAIDVDKLSPDYLADFYNVPEFKETLDPEMINKIEFKKAMGRLMQVSYKDITGEEKFENILPYPNYYTFVRFGNDIYLAHEYGKYHTKLSFGVRLRKESLNEESKVEYQVHYTVLKGKDASKGVASYDDKDDARKFYNDMVNDEEVVSAKIRKIIGRDPSRDTMGGFARHQGSEIDLEKYIHPAYFKKDRELEGQDKNIKMFLGTPSFILKKRGFTSDSPYFEEGLEEGMSDGGFNDNDEKTIIGHAKEAATEAGALEPKFSPKLGGIMVRFPHSSGPSGAALTAMGQRTMSGQILDDTKRAATHAGEMFIDMVKEDPTLPQLEQDLLVVEYGPGEIAQVIVIPF